MRAKYTVLTVDGNKEQAWSNHRPDIADDSAETLRKLLVELNGLQVIIEDYTQQWRPKPLRILRFMAGNISAIEIKVVELCELPWR